MSLRNLTKAVALAAAAFVLCAVALVVSGTREHIARADLIVVPGNTVNPDSSLSPRLEARCARALELHRAGDAPVIFASGGIEPGGLDESALMKRWFVAQGVPDSAVVTDSLGANSWRTAQNAARWLREHGRRGALVVTQGFHVPRMRLACERAGIAPVYWSHARFWEMRDFYSIARELPGLASYALRQAPRAPPRAHRAPDRATARLTDQQLLERVQRQTFRFFWDGGHPVSGLARDRISTAPPHADDVCTSGGSGFGVMTIVIATERGWVGRTEALERLLRMTAFLQKAERHHGVFPHWLNGSTGRTIPFGDGDDGGDIVETAYLFEGLLTARQYFARPDPAEATLRRRIDSLWREVDWTAHVAPGESALAWLRSPRTGFAPDGGVSGWNEALITYVLAAGSPTHPIDSTLYHRGWARDGAMMNGRKFYGIRLPLGPDYGGPLFFEHYSFMGLDPRGLEDRYASYWEQCVNHTLINREYCVRNPKGYRGYGARAWGLTASDVKDGYAANSPTEDSGTITPSAALSSFPYTPTYSMQALRHFHDEMGGSLWSEYGFVDAFDETRGWTAASHLAIDQGPIVVMIENYRSRLPWKLFMSCPEVQAGLRRLGFRSPWLR